MRFRASIWRCGICLRSGAQEPVIPSARRSRARRTQFYATGARPDLAKEMGFIGGKMPLQHGPAEGEEGLAKNIAKLADMRNKVGDDFWLMLDCWMSLDLELCHTARAGGAGVRPEMDRRSAAAR